MQVFAVVEDVSCLGEQAILMTCEDKRVFAYDDECLHLVAKDLKELLKEGLRCPAYEKYYDGDAFNHMTEEDWAKEKQSPLGKKLDEEHRELVESFEPRILEILRSTRSKQELTSDSTDKRSCMLSSEGLKDKMDDPLKYSHLARQLLDLSTFPTSTGKTAQDFLASVRNYVSANKGQIIPLKKPHGAKLRITDVDDTIYRDDKYKMYARRNLFLPDPTHMQVFAVVEDATSWFKKPILMICKNKRVYAYNDKGRHLMASSLEELLYEGLRWPEYGDYDEHDEEEDFMCLTWAKEKQSPLGKKPEHRDQSRIVKILRSASLKKELTSDSTD